MFAGSPSPVCTVSSAPTANTRKGQVRKRLFATDLAITDRNLNPKPGTSGNFQEEAASTRVDVEAENFYSDNDASYKPGSSPSTSSGYELSPPSKLKAVIRKRKGSHESLT